MSDNLKSSNSAITGIIVSDARLGEKLTREEVVDKTLINTKFIKAIESGDYTDFPSEGFAKAYFCLLYTSPSPRDAHESRMPSSA